MTENTTAANTPPFGLPLPDAGTVLRSWQDAQAPWQALWATQWQAQCTETATSVAREACRAGLQIAEQAAGHTSRWFAAVGERTQQLARAAEASARKAAGAADAAALWGAEWDLINESVLIGSAAAQQDWAAAVDQHTRMAQAWLTQGSEGFQRFAGLAAGWAGQGPARVDPASETPVLSVDGMAPWLDWMAQATQAAQATTQAVCQAAAGNGAPRRPPRAR
ncbi:MAG: hypothetical protein JNL30_12830 [Rubrivivax sp.]|nr:hypothetical protein [Rubrivivax sp.]